MHLLRRLPRIVWSLADHSFSMLVAIWRLLFGALGVLREAERVAVDFVRSRRSLRHGTLHCPRGHAIETEGGVYQCGRCSFTYRGSILLCANPECPSPVTQFLDCPDCGLSVRTPYRWGRP